MRPGLGDLVEGERLDVDPDLPGGHMPRDLEVRVAKVLGREHEVRVAENRETLEPHRAGQKRRLRSRRLTDLDDAGARRRGIDGGADRLAPQRIDDQRRTVATACLAEPVLEIVTV